MGKAERAGLEFRPSEAGLKDRTAYGFMASHFLRVSSLSRNSPTGEVRAGKLSASHLTVSGLWRPATHPLPSRGGELNDCPQPPGRKKQRLASSVGSSQVVAIKDDRGPR